MVTSHDLLMRPNNNKEESRASCCYLLRHKGTHTHTHGGRACRRRLWVWGGKAYVRLEVSRDRERDENSWVIVFFCFRRQKANLMYPLPLRDTARNGKSTCVLSANCAAISIVLCNSEAHRLEPCWSGPRVLGTCPSCRSMPQGVDSLAARCVVLRDAFFVAHNGWISR